MTAPRLLFMAKPTPEVLVQMTRAAAGAGLDARLGTDLFAPANWHQSLSDVHPASAATESRLLRAGGRIAARAFTLTLNRISGRGRSHPIHWAFLARGRPSGFDALIAAVRAAMLEEGFMGEGGHSPHVTVSYRAPAPMPSTKISPISLPISEVLLVQGGGRPYHYEVLTRWPLAPDLDPPWHQQDLF